MLRPVGRSGSVARAPGRRLHTVLIAGAVLGVVGLLFHLAHGQLGLGGRGLDSFADDWVYNAVIVGGALSCVARGVLVREERLAWLVLGIGLAFDATGEIYYSLAFGDSGNVPIPSLADLFYLLYYPAGYAGLVLLARKRVRHLSGATWLDGAIAAAASVALIAALWFDPIVESARHGSSAAVATNFAYPVGDLILLVIVIGTYTLLGWRPGRTWLLLGIGFGLAAMADVGYLYGTANGSYTVGGILDSLWIASAIFTGASAWQPIPNRKSTHDVATGVGALAIPVVFSLAALGVLVYGGFAHVDGVGLALAAVAVLFAFIRGGWTFRENLRLLAASRRDALTDALTGLGNRRAMSTELERCSAPAAGARSSVLVMFDLDGFKAYNDRFGHVAGDTLLAHLGKRLLETVAGVGRAFRLGGDEFCVVFGVDLAHAEPHVATAVRALSASGDGFSVRTSYGVVSIPEDAPTATAALRLADDRMYAQKGSRRGSARQQTHDVLLEVLRERQPDLHHHLCEVGQLAVLVGRGLGMDDEQLDELGRAAELHDVGKAAVPDAILDKPGPLDEDEWAFMRRHTLVGERILAAAPALAQVAVIVRSSHERWDGTGYPDGLEGEAIPLGARVVSACDAFDAMVSDRPYAGAMSPDEALAELRRGAGTQFDPQVVDAFVSVWPQHASSIAPAGEDECDEAPDQRRDRARSAR